MHKLIEIPFHLTRFHDREEWEKIIEDWEKSGLKRSTYCKLQHLSYKTFYTWHNKLRPHCSLTDEELKKRWERLISNWEKSGLSKAAYCKAKGLNANTFYLREKEFNPHIIRKTGHMKAAEKWTPIVEDWKKSGLSKFAYCKRYDIDFSSFYRWIERNVPSLIQGTPTSLSKESQIESSSREQETDISSYSNALGPSSCTNQKIEIFLYQGKRFCLEGPFDWQKLTDWLVPLLTR